MIPSPSWNPTSSVFAKRHVHICPGRPTSSLRWKPTTAMEVGKWWKMMENLGISMSSGCHFCLSELEKTTAFDPTRIRGCKATPQTHILQHQVTLDRFKATAPFKCLGIGNDGILYGIFVTRYPWKLKRMGVLWYYGDRDEILIKSHIFWYTLW